MFKSRKNFLNQFYAMMPTTDISGLGVALIVLDQNKKNIKGMKILANGNLQKFDISHKLFQELIDNQRIELVETAPDDVVEEMKQIYLHS